MPVVDFADLVMTVSEYVKRADLANVMDRFVAMAELDIERECRFEDQHASATLTLTNRRASLPTNFYMVRTVATTSTPTMHLNRVSKHFEQDPTECVRPGYTLDGNEIVTFGGPFASVKLSYFARLPRLTQAAPTNWLLSIAPDVLLAGTVFHALTWAGDERAAGAGETFMSRMKAVKRAETSRRFTNAAIQPEHGLP